MILENTFKIPQASAMYLPWSELMLQLLHARLHLRPRTEVLHCTMNEQRCCFVTRTRRRACDADPSTSTLPLANDGKTPLSHPRHDMIEILVTYDRVNFLSMFTVLQEDEEATEVDDFEDMNELLDDLLCDRDELFERQ